MERKCISLNPLAEYLAATESRKRRIISEQQNPDPVKIPRYQLAKARIKKSILNNLNQKTIDVAITELTTRNPDKKWKINDRELSIIALKNFKGMKFPSLISDYKLEEISVKQKSLFLYGLEILIAPNLIFRITKDGKKYIGALKIHVSKSKPFVISQSSTVAALINLYLNEAVAKEDEIVLPELCLCIDLFNKTTVNSQSKIKYDMSNLKAVCREISVIWEQLVKAA